MTIWGYELFGGQSKYAGMGDTSTVSKKLKEDIKVIGIRHGEKMYETLLTDEECACAIDMGDFYRVPADNRDLNYDKFFTDGNSERVKLVAFNSDNTKLLTVEETRTKIEALEYIQNELNGVGNPK